MGTQLSLGVPKFCLKLTLVTNFQTCNSFIKIILVLILSSTSIMVADKKSQGLVK